MAGWRPERRALFVLLLITVLVVAVVVRPLAEAVLIGAVLAAVLWPLQRGMTRRLGERPTLAASLIVVGVVLLVLAPLVGLVTFLVQQAIDAVTFVQAVVRGDAGERLITSLPDVIEEPVRRWLDTLEAPVGQLASSLVGAMSTISATIAATGSIAFQVAMSLVALFFFLTNKDEVIDWLDDASPFEERQTRELLAEVRRVSVSVVRSTVLTAGVQTAVASVGYLAAGVPYWAFFAGVTFFMALIPAVGASIVCVAVAAILLAIGKPIGALLLAAWGLIVVGLSDNLVKPLLMKSGVRMHGVVVLFALLGGIGAFGPIGLIVGPLSVALFVAVLRIYRRDYGGDVPSGGPVGAETSGA